MAADAIERGCKGLQNARDRGCREARGHVTAVTELCCDQGTASPRTTGDTVEQARATSREGSRTEARSVSPELGRPLQIRDEGREAGCGGPEWGSRAPNEGDGESCPWDFSSLGWWTQEGCVEGKSSGKQVQDLPVTGREGPELEGAVRSRGGWVREEVAPSSGRGQFPGG